MTRQWWRAATDGDRWAVGEGDRELFTTDDREVAVLAGAAPKLLAAAKAFRANLWKSDAIVGMAPEIDALDAAIADAEGRSGVERCPKCGGTHPGRYEGACAGPPLPSGPPPHKMMG